MSFGGAGSNEDLDDLYEIIDSLSTEDLVRMAGGHIESGEAMNISGQIRTRSYEEEISALQVNLRIEEVIDLDNLAFNRLIMELTEEQRRSLREIRRRARNKYYAMQTRQKKNDEIKTLKAKVAAEAKELDENKAKHRELTEKLRDGLNELRGWQRFLGYDLRTIPGFGDYSPRLQNMN